MGNYAELRFHIPMKRFHEPEQAYWSEYVRLRELEDVAVLWEVCAECRTLTPPSPEDELAKELVDRLAKTLSNVMIRVVPSINDDDTPCKHRTNLLRLRTTAVEFLTKEVQCTICNGSGCSWCNDDSQNRLPEAEYLEFEGQTFVCPYLNGDRVTFQWYCPKYELPDHYHLLFGPKDCRLVVEGEGEKCAIVDVQYHTDISNALKNLNIYAAAIRRVSYQKRQDPMFRDISLESIEQMKEWLQSYPTDCRIVYDYAEIAWMMEQHELAVNRCSQICDWLEIPESLPGCSDDIH